MVAAKAKPAGAGLAGGSGEDWRLAASPITPSPTQRRMPLSPLQRQRF